LDISIESGWNDILLISRIEQGWTPRYAEAFIQAARLRKQIKKTNTVTGVRHFLLFKNKSIADHAKQLVDEAKFESEIIDHDSGVTLAVRQGAPLTEEYVEHVTVQLGKIASKAGGTYDAWETTL
jgi:hypothetical protein